MEFLPWVLAAFFRVAGPLGAIFEARVGFFVSLGLLTGIWGPVKKRERKLPPVTFALVLMFWECARDVRTGDTVADFACGSCAPSGGINESCPIKEGALGIHAQV
jgi:hypothetical protein